MSFWLKPKFTQMVTKLFELMCRCDIDGKYPGKLRSVFKSLHFLDHRSQITYLNLSEHPIASSGKSILAHFTNSSSPPLALLDTVSKQA